MKNSKKRLEDIIEKFQKAVQQEMSDDDFVKLIEAKKQTITKILKEFVHKDSLPSEKTITEIISGTSCDGDELCYECSMRLAKKIRKLIEE